MKTKIHATIPSVQYGNIRPVFELEDGDDEGVAIDKLKELWSRFGESPLKDRQGGGVKVETFTGEVLMWDETNHVYTDMDGNVMLSGSKYAEQNSPKFDLAMMLPKTANAWNVDEKMLGDLWKMNSNVSTHWGSSIHLALEIAHNYYEMGEKIKEQKELEDNYVLPKQPYLRNVVTEFIDKFGLHAVAEPIVSDVANKMAGTIDRLKITGTKKCRVGDYKTNAELKKKDKDKYQLQLSFYAQILKNKGWEVEGLDLYHYDGESWTLHELEVLDIELDK
jgi:hypothetical protein